MKKFARVLALAMVFAMMLSMTAFAAGSTTWIEMSIEDDEGKGGLPYRVRHSGESSHYLTEDALLLVEVVAIVNEMYDPHDPTTDLWDFDSKGMKDIMDEGLDAYADSHAVWSTYVDTHYTDVNPLIGMRTLKDLLKDPDATLGEIIPNVAHKISFQNEVKGDKKYGVTYTVTITRYNDISPELNVAEGIHAAYVKGYPDGTVRPTASITRAEVATIFYRLMTEEARGYYQTESNAFVDCDADAWYNEAVSTMAAAGVLRGYEDGTFRPNAPVTRAEFVSIVTRMTEEGRGDILNAFKGVFTDVAQGAWYTPAVELANDLGWALGFEGKYRPGDNMTRAEVMTMVNRILKRDVQTEDMLAGMITWPDNVKGAWYYEAVQEATNSHTFTRTDEQVPQQSFNYEIWTELVK